MTNKQILQKWLICAGCLILALSIISSLIYFKSEVSTEKGTSRVVHEASCAPDCTSHEKRSPMDRLAARMQKRIAARFATHIEIEELKSLIDQKKTLLNRKITVNVKDEDGKHPTIWELSVSDYPQIVAYNFDAQNASILVSPIVLQGILSEGLIESAHAVSDVHIDAMETGKYVTRADNARIARSGFDYVGSNAIGRIASALMDEHTDSIELTVANREPIITMNENGTTKTLSLLSSGKSNFANSPSAREANIHKALEEHVSNVLVAPGGKFSFNATLEGPVTLDKGWKEAIGLFGGGAAMTPGGGICQAATTVYRAALLAGFPILEKRNHSLYVSYYEQYGVGVDATIFPGVHDLVFLNDSPDWVLVQAYSDGLDAVVNLYGTDDGRTVALDGPYFVNSRPRPGDLRPIGHDEIGWLQRVHYANGTDRTQQLISQYAKGVPFRSLSQKYLASIRSDTFHAAAPEEAE